MTIFHAHGKLLISAEYMVMHGSKALAVPLQQGQSLHKIRSENREVFTWKAFYQEQLWFHASLDPASLKILDTGDTEMAQRLQQMITACIELMPSFQEDLVRWDVETFLEFSPLWGFGSSSTLITLLAVWAEINPLDLHFQVSDGSGYDVACATAEGPILYTLRDHSPHYQHVPFDPPFSHQLYFAWLGKKQLTAAHLKQLAGGVSPDDETILHFSQLTDRMIAADNLDTFQALMMEHEEKLSQILGIEKISTSRFPGLPGTVKSLGAWGGDFVMIASGASEKELFDYLYQRDIQLIYRYQELIYHGTELRKGTSA